MPVHLPGVGGDLPGLQDEGVVELFFVVDVEATCGPPSAQLDRRQREVIELGVVAVDGSTRRRLGEWSALVRPRLRPKLSDYCSALTGIGQAEVDAAEPFPEVWARLARWSVLQAASTATFCAWGGFDRDILRRECAREGLPWLLGRHHLDLRKAFARRRGRRWESPGLRSAAAQVGLLMGTRHRALPDARLAADLLPWCLPQTSEAASLRGGPGSELGSG